VAESSGLPWVPPNFLAITGEHSQLANAKAVLIPVPYDSTTSFRSGAREGPAAIIQASYGLEDYDCELDLDVSQVGIHTTAALEPHLGSPQAMVERVRDAVRGYVKLGKTVGLLGGEHSIAVGAVQAYREMYSDLSVLYLDAHADLRHQYLDTAWGHASGARRIHELCPLVLVGVRSLCQEERDYIRGQSVPTFFCSAAAQDEVLQREVLAQLTPSVYVSVDLDVFDPSFMAAVGTPEPGGLGWYDVLHIARRVAETRHIVGFDVVELFPIPGNLAPDFMAAKLVYKLLGYRFKLGKSHPG